MYTIIQNVQCSFYPVAFCISPFAQTECLNETNADTESILSCFFQDHTFIWIYEMDGKKGRIQPLTFHSAIEATTNKHLIYTTKVEWMNNENVKLMVSFVFSIYLSFSVVGMRALAFIFLSSFARHQMISIACLNVYFSFFFFLFASKWIQWKWK